MCLRWFLLCLFLAFCVHLNAAPVINEIMAANSTGLQDEDGDFSDWLEIFNPDATAVNLEGWHLTDSAANLVKWRFPATTIPAGGYLVIYASNKNRQVPGSPLHTNFALSTGGEYLALVAADGSTVISSFAPTFPAQVTDVSYGMPSNVETTTLVAANAACRWKVPSSSTNPDYTAWRAISYSDSSWTLASMGIGYDNNTSGVNYLPEIGTAANVGSAMYNIRTSCFIRVPFTCADASKVLSLKLRMKYDDGFVAYLNGQPLLSGGAEVSRNKPASLTWNSASSADHSDSLSIIYEDFDVSSSINQLVTGTNVLAFQALNKGTTSSDLLCKAELTAETATTNAPMNPGYFALATPGARNGGPGTLVVPQSVTFSYPAGTFTTNFSLTLSGNATGQIIRYTTDGTIPNSSSTLYTSAISVTASTLFRARIFDATTGAAGFVCGAAYEKLGTTVSSYGSSGLPFRSSLPVLVLNNRGAGEVANDDVYHDARVQLFDRDSTGYSNVSTSLAFTAAAGVKLRGSSSASFAKKSYSLELRNEAGDARSISVLGMPSCEDWSLVSCYSFDLSFMRNAWVYETGRATGRWSPRFRFVEVFFNQDGNDLDYSDYRGVYVLCETVRDNPSRADVTHLQSSDTTQPAVSGGYIFKVDRYDADEYHWFTSRSLPPATASNALVIYRPKMVDLATEQGTYITSYFQTFEDALFTDAASSFTTRNYRQYIDSASWIDHSLFNAFAKNVDALRLSAYFVKDRGRRIEGGPLWDFDRSANSTDSRDDAYNTWIGTGDGTDYFNYAWWQPLFQDIEFRQLFVDRWQELRNGPIATTAIQARIDGFLTEFKIADADHPAKRDYARWYGSATAYNLQTETINLKTWLANRAAWIDSQFTPAPIVVTAPGIISSGQSVTLGVPSGTTVYYRLDGLDPRAEGGGVRAGSVVYNGTPITLTSTKQVTARAWRSGTYSTPATNWSGIVKPLYLINEIYASTGNLRVTTVHYNPLGPNAAEILAIPDVSASDFEWIEVSNNGTVPINLQGVTLDSGKPVSAMTLPSFTLAPGDRGIVVKRLAAFMLRHANAASHVVTEWIGDHSLSNDGEEIIIRDRSGVIIADFSYNDHAGWPSRADGLGAALEYIGVANTTMDYQTASNWRSSAEVDGAPGSQGSGPRLRVLINEVLASSVWPQVDAIELFNPTSSAINIGGWYLSNTSDAITDLNYKKFRIPNGTVIPAGGYLVFSEADFNPNGSWNASAGNASDWEFSLDGYRGGDVWLISANVSTGVLDAFEDHVTFTPSLVGITQGRWPDGTNNFMPLAARSIFNENSAVTPRPPAGATNAGPYSGGVQISEIMYHPLTGTPEYVEIVNTRPVSESLDQWTLRGDVEFNFGPTVTLAAGECILLVSFDPDLLPATATAFRSIYQVPTNIRLIGPWSSGKSLGNTSGAVRLRRKIPTPVDAPLLVGLMLEDESEYFAAAPWPIAASGTGLAIQRLGISCWGNDPDSWIAATASPGKSAGGWLGWKHEFFPTGGALSDEVDDFDHDGVPNIFEYILGTDPLVAGVEPWSSFVQTNEASPSFVLEYRIRRDRTDVSVNPCFSMNLKEWQNMMDVRHVADEELYEVLHAVLPMNTNLGFIRLKYADIP